MFITIIVFLAVLSILVFFHEFGHFFAARKLGVKADEFGFGFPPRVFGFYKNKDKKWKRVFGNKKIEDNIDTVYSVNLIPLGGFVKIKGENGQGKKDPDSFASKKIWKRAVILSSGVFMNVVLASILISIGLMIGFPQAVDKDNLKNSVKISDEKIQIAQVLPDSPAIKAGIKAGDVLLSINGQEVKSEENVSEFISNSIDQEIVIQVNRFNEELNFSLEADFVNNSEQKIIGIAFSQTATVKYPWYLAIWEGLKMTITLLWAIIYAFYDLIKNLIIGQSVGVEVAGPIGIADLTGQMARMGFVYLLQFTALLSLNLAVINFLPFPALDGGRLVFLLFEKIKGRPVKEELEAVFHNLGFILLMALVVWVTFKDILKLFN